MIGDEGFDLVGERATGAGLADRIGAGDPEEGGASGQLEVVEHGRGEDAGDFALHFEAGFGFGENDEADGVPAGELALGGEMLREVLGVGEENAVDGAAAEALAEHARVLGEKNEQGQAGGFEVVEAGEDGVAIGQAGESVFGIGLGEGARGSRGFGGARGNAGVFSEAKSGGGDFPKLEFPAVRGGFGCDEEGYGGSGGGMIPAAPARRGSGLRGLEKGAENGLGFGGVAGLLIGGEPETGVERRSGGAVAGGPGEELESGGTGRLERAIGGEDEQGVAGGGGRREAGGLANFLFEAGGAGETDLDHRGDVAHLERLDEVGHGADGFGAGDGGIVGEGGDEADRNIGGFAHTVDGFDAVDVGAEVDVHEDEVGFALLDGAESVGGPGFQADVVVFPGEHLLDHGADGGVVLDDEDVGQRGGVRRGGAGGRLAGGGGGHVQLSLRVRGAVAGGKSD